MCVGYMKIMPYITITRIPYEEPYHIRLVIVASNGPSQGQLEIYINPEVFLSLADVLEAFPRHSSDVHLWELGSERPEDRFAYYFRFRLFTTDSTGHCAIQLRFNNNLGLPDREITEFCIEVEPASLTRLGTLIREFAQLKHEVLNWNLAEGKLFRTRAEYDVPS
jgi:hypothetical protein